MMNRLEAAARQALEALEHSHANEPIWKTPHRDAAAALREALAEQQPAQQAADPVAQVCCGQFETCTQACTPRGKFLGQREALAKQASALAKQQAFVDSLPAGDDKMFEQIHLWAMQSYKRHRGSTAGQQITAADSFDTHIIWAALRWAGEHQAPTQQAAKPSSVLVEGFGRVAMRKLNDLREKGYAINGVSIATISEAGETNRGAVTTGGMVLWWPQQPAQQAADPVAYSIDKDQEGIRAKVCDAVSGALAYGALGLNPAPEGHWLEPFWKMARAERDSRDSTLQPKFWYDEEDAVLYGLNEDRPNGCILLCTPAPTQQPLTDEQKAVLRECRNKAMKWAAQAGIPECAAFGGMAQDLDWLCGQLGITGSKT